MTEAPEVQNLSEETTEKPKRRWRMTRRGFLIGAGATGATLAVGAYFGKPRLHLFVADQLESSSDSFGGLPSDPDLWLEVLPDSRIRLYVSKVEMGQGVHTSIAQLAVEELGTDWADLEVQQASTASGVPDSFGTGGSTSIPTSYKPLRQAAATMREMLHHHAAQLLGQPVDAVEMNGRGFALKSDPATRVDFADVAAFDGDWQAPEEPMALKTESEFQVIGQSIPRNDIPLKVTGEAIYGYDARLPGMLYGVVAHPPTLEATLNVVWPLDARSMPGVADVVIDKASNFVGVVAQSRKQAKDALDAMDIQWTEGRLWQQEELDRMIVPSAGKGVTVQREGNIGSAMRNAETMTAEYRSPFAVQAPLEPQSALADVQATRVNIWVSTQSADRTRGQIADAIGVDAEIIEVQPTFLGGGFGRKLDTLVAVEAARLSQAVGAPVHVGWDRPDALRQGYFRPPTHSKLTGVLDENGRIAAIEHLQGSGNVAFGFMPKFLEFALGADFGSWRGSKIVYDVPNIETIAWNQELPVWTGWWRGLGLVANTFAVESFMDEMADAAGVDQLQFRLDHMPDTAWGKRMTAVLEAAGGLGEWGTPVPEGRARGVACSTDVDTVVAQVAEISLDTETGKISVHKISCAMDCGLTINPDGAQAQIQGSIMWGVGTALIEQMKIRDGRVDLNNFDTYPLLTMKEAPQVETVLLEAEDKRPRGVGEPPMGPVAAAIGNALFNLTSVRMRELPMTPERVLEALA